LNAFRGKDLIQEKNGEYKYDGTRFYGWGYPKMAKLEVILLNKI
jgi:hypothetical protein